MKKSLTSFVLVNLAAMLTRPLERFYTEKRHVHVQVNVLVHAGYDDRVILF